MRKDSDAAAALAKLPVWVTWFRFDGKKVTALVRAETEAEAIQRMVNWNPDIKLVSGGDGKHYGAILWDTGVHYENDETAEASPPTKTLKQVAAEMAESRDNASKQQVSLRKLMKRDKNPTLKLTDRALTAKIQDINWWLYRLAILTTSTDETDGKGGTK